MGNKINILNENFRRTVDKINILNENFNFMSSANILSGHKTGNSTKNCDFVKVHNFCYGQPY
jgi:hypothetical protein